MQYNDKMCKVYSRNRIRIGGFYNSNKGNKNSRIKNKIKKVTPSFMVMVIAILTCYTIWNAINPVFETICEDKAKAIATEITNEETTKVMNKYNYDTFFTVEKDENQNVKLITANVLKINVVTSDIALNIQKALNESERASTSIPLGSVTGIKMFSGMGPRISIKLATVGNVETDLKSEFVAQGVNQTIHRVYLEINSTVNILTSFSTIQRTITNQVLIAENVILGEIPSTYYNFEGSTDEESTALEIVE